ncbi:hypothetical protein C3747_70g174 [Trypanosoma cruzi]|uniref:Endonuclease/exonuclease/phosphatase domain-containing protein n=1 Tax=Trypanosoma cruzi TaxID=5693 RepID=A0A2V2WPC6_TRYCR|nr:hypothetical protein C3747_70g174 [Trypanosoma cruzi]
MVRGNTMGEQQELGALRPGGLLHYDYRTDAAKTEKLPETFRVVQWNIERGIQFERIVQTLRVIRADVLLLQEVDINCRRSDYRNVARDLAEALKMEMYFACEFEELDAVDRAPKNAVGPFRHQQPQFVMVVMKTMVVLLCTREDAIFMAMPFFLQALRSVIHVLFVTRLVLTGKRRDGKGVSHGMVFVTFCVVVSIAVSAHIPIYRICTFTVVILRYFVGHCQGCDNCWMCSVMPQAY